MAKSHIIEWQTKIGVTPDGDFGPQTLARSLEIYGQVAPPPAPKPPNPPAPDGGYRVIDHALYRDGVAVNYKSSPNRGVVIKPEIVVIHYTGDNSLQGALSWLCKSGSKVSAHLVIAKSGQVWQLVPFNRAAWHAGQSEYDGRSGVNGFSIGIENVGLGDEWPEAQIQANIDVIRALDAAYNIQDVVGHSDVATPQGRKIDPGPKYPWERVW